MFPSRDRIRRSLGDFRRGRYWTVSVVGGLIILAIGILSGMAAVLAPSTWTASFPSGDTLISNELAYAQPDRSGVKTSDDWIVTSGSLFSDEHAGWTGPIDGDTPDLRSSRHTGSAVFRAVTRRDDFRDVTVDFDLYIREMTTTRRTGKHAYDGVHVFLRYHNPQSLYAVSVVRRDDSAAVKIKRPGGPSDGGEYTTLGAAPIKVPSHRWVHEKIRIVNQGADVRITLWTDGREILNVLSNGSGSSAPLVDAGRVGLRGDNTEFLFRHFRVSPA